MLNKSFFSRPALGILLGFLLLTGGFLVLDAISLWGNSWYASPVDIQPQSAGGQTTSSNYKSYYNAEFGYTITYPAKWQLTPGLPDSRVATLISKNNKQVSASLSGQGGSPENPESGYGKVDIVAYPLESSLTALEFAQSISQEPLRGNFYWREVAGQPALLLETTVTSSSLSSSHNLKYRNVYLTKGQSGFIIAGLCDEVTFGTLLESFQLA